MLMPASRDSVTTIEVLLALPEDGLRHELLDGVHVVTPCPRPLHEVAFIELLKYFGEALSDRPDLALFGGKGDLVLGPRTLVQPDVFVVRKVPGKPFQAWSEVGVPLLAVEILSPATAPYDRGAKRRIYQRAGVGEYWIVDLDARIVERWTPGNDRPEILDDSLRWSLPGGTTGELTLPEFFAKVYA